MQHDARHDQSGRRREREDTETDRVPQNTDDHRLSPTQFRQHCPKDRHRPDLSNLPDAHHGHHPVGLDADVLQKAVGPNEIALVNIRIEERNHKQN